MANATTKRVIQLKCHVGHGALIRDTDSSDVVLASNVALFEGDGTDSTIIIVF